MSKQKIKISEVLQLLEEGKTRPEVAEHYGISMADCRKLFKHPKLKGRKAHKAPDFVLEDDLEEGGSISGELSNENSANEETQLNEEVMASEAERQESENAQAEQEQEVPNWSN